MYTANEIAHFIVSFHNERIIPITNLRLQKILYYVQGYSYCRNQEPIFEDEIYRWPYGPVVPEVYYEYCINGSDEITENESNSDDKICYQTRSLIEKVCNACKDYGSFELVKKTHYEDPWKNAKDRSIISKNATQSYFLENDPLKIKD